ncbi:LacI family DNA-binding transcriptional regulator [Conservatibacter flavescens]|uniref:LacI family transcriptional regulator n=1 Tax=Conservatibacter flavescens TaxID=28161 RepID=A0A2M8S1N8_9PAST|nr:LacI family DNA-binding transcriptional regulator [Conservatibacter flavescens]PJG85071.1 LacI family transcriptional regulator [Conservatibacter flavescens]
MFSSKDVAKRAGVSQTTVSRVLNTPERVKAKTRDKVLQVIQELGYVRNENARNLVAKRTYTISLISGPLHNPFYVDTTSRIIQYATTLGYKVNVHFSTIDNAQHIYELALSHKIDGLIMSCVLLDDPIVEQLKKLNLPFISFNRRHSTARHFVEIDNIAAGRKALQHLVDLAHTDILWIGASDVVSTFRDRFIGFKQHYEWLKKQPNSSKLNVRTINYKQLDQPDLRKLLTKLYQTKRLPSAICAATDAMAIAAMEILISLGVSIPEDISIIGIDNVDLSGNYLVQLTTVGAENNTCLGLLAIQKLIEMIEHKDKLDEFSITLPVSLYTRGSTQQYNQ